MARGCRLDPDPGPRAATARPLLTAGAGHDPYPRPTGRRDMTSVGYKLYRQIRDLAPRDWTSGERLVAWIIADDANDQTRRSFITGDELCHRAGMTERGVRKALEKLAEAGFEFRVAHGKGKDGRPVYATRWQPPEYQVPDIFQHMIRAAGMAYGLVDSPPQGGTTVPPLAGLSTG